MRTLVKRTGLLCLLLCIVFSALPVKAHADIQIDKVLATTSHTPVALMDVSTITAATSTSGCYIAGYNWVNSSGTMSGKFSTDTCRVEIRIQAYDGFSFSEEVTAYLNNESATVSRDPSGSFVDISRDYAPLVWAPTIVKHPGGETVEAGGWASFVASATYTDDCSWVFVSPEGKYFSGDELHAKFPDVSVNDNGEGKVNIHGIPAEMDGWKVVCRFEGPGGTVDTNGAKITVKPDPAAVTPSPEPTPEPTPEPSEAPEAETEKEHEHKFSEEYTGDLMNHWQRCDCGETTEKQQHSMEWTVIKEASKKEAGEEKGVCSSCGYSQTREIPATGGKARADAEDEGFLKLGKFGILIKVLLAIAGIIGGFILIMYIRYKARRRKYRIKNRRY